jgi:Flp pilus assembly protein TadD
MTGMSTRRLVAWVSALVAGGLAVLGFIVFVVGVLLELLIGGAQPLTEELSPAMQLALVGLCLSAIMMVFGFVLVGVLLAVQTRRQAPGYGEAYRLIQQMQFNQAIPLLEQAVRLGRETPEVLMLLTTAYANSGQLAKAQATADRAVQLFPSDPQAYITLANGYRQQASYDEAADALGKAVELAPEQPFVKAEQGFLYLLAGKQAQAHEIFQQIGQLPLPSIYGVRVNYHLYRAFKDEGRLAEAAEARGRMAAARDGLDAWYPVVKSMEGTAYGTFLRYEIAAIEAELSHHAEERHGRPD